jgi:hypothetical protein
MKLSQETSEQLTDSISFFQQTRRYVDSEGVSELLGFWITFRTGKPFRVALSQGLNKVGVSLT